MKKKFLPFVIILSILVIDQVLKIWIKTTLIIGEEIPVFGNWFILHFLENEGMAFGMSFGGAFGKIILSTIRIAAVILIGWYISKLVKKNEKTSVIVALSLIFAGAAGNIIDSCFYGIIFTDSYLHIATMFPTDGGYAPFLHGKVVDMFYFPLFSGTYPNWFPIVGGQNFLFFRPVFNFADTAITIGVIMFFILQLGNKKVENDELKMGNI